MGTKVTRYLHHGVNVAVRSDLMGQHRNYCLCYLCRKFKPGEEDNCLRAARLYEFCVKYDMVTPVWECPVFEGKADTDGDGDTGSRGGSET